MNNHELTALLLPWGQRVEGRQLELRAQRNRERWVSLLSGSLVTNTRSEQSGVCARVRDSGVFGFASMAELSHSAVERVLREAEGNAALLARHVSQPKPSRSPQPRAAIAPAPVWKDAEQAAYIAYLRELDGYLAELPGLCSRRLSIRCDSVEKALCTGDGAVAHTALPRCYLIVTLSAEGADGTPVELFRSYGGFGGFSDWFGDPALLKPELERRYAQLMEKRDGVYPKAGRATCILGGELSGMLAHEAVGHTVEADLVLGGSVGGPCLHRQVASELVSMTDFAAEAFGKPAPLPILCDEEGVQAVDAPLIENGVLVGYMNNRDTAEQFRMPPRGNARANLFSDEPLIRMRNTAVHPGKDRLSDMIASVDEGYYLVSSSNGQADTTGEFMFGVTQGYEIRHGKLGRPILDTTISGVAFEMLKTVDMVSDEVEWSSVGFCGKKQYIPVGLGGPALRCQVTIGGR